MGGGVFSLLVLLLAIPDTLAQTYIDPVHGSGTACTETEPCTLAYAYANKQNRRTRNYIWRIRVRRAGGMVRLAALTGTNSSLTEEITFGTYVKGSAAKVKGKIEFTGNFQIASAGSVRLEEEVSAQFADVTLLSGSRAHALHFFSDKDGSDERVTVAGTLTIPADETTVTLEGLIVSENLTVKSAGTETGVFRVWGKLIVKRGATLRLDNVDLYFHMGSRTLKEGSKFGEIFVLDGAIEDVTKGSRHPITLASLNNDDEYEGRAGSGDFVTHVQYKPLVRGLTVADCLFIEGSGTLNAGLYLIAMGNVCVQGLTQVGPITVTGGIQNDVQEIDDPNTHSGKLTTDLIFREDVIIDGDVAQWNDSRILFEKRATIRGNVTMQDGGTPYDHAATFGANDGTLGEQITDASARRGYVPWQFPGTLAGPGQKYTCEYTINRKKILRENAHHVPGVQFAGLVTIAGDLNVYSNTIPEVTEDTNTSSERDDDNSDNTTSCAPRVLFIAPAVMRDATRDLQVLSSVGGNLVIEDTVSFGGQGRVFLDGDVRKVGNANLRSAHNLLVGGDLEARGKALGMKHASTSMSQGMCTAKDVSLTFGNRIVLTDAGESVVIGDATNGLTLGALVTLGDLRVEPGKGPLTVKTLHVGPRAELMAKEVKVTESLLLQGELDGELDASSTIKRLTYGNRNTDLVKNAALATTMEVLSVDVGDRGILRLDERVKTETLELCSGTLSLVDTESTTDSTLHVTEQITVQNGMLVKDANDPGSISTDKAKTANVADRYMLTYITPGAREVKAGDLEWFDPRDVTVNHAKAEIMAPNGRSLPGKLMVTKGKLTVDGMLTVGTSTLHRTASGTNAQDALAQVNRYSVEVAAGELHTKGQDVMVHGKVTVSGKSKLMTGGGDLHVLGRVLQGEYAHNTAQVTIAKDAMVDLGDGTLMLGPQDTKKRNNVRDLNGYNKGTDGNGANSRPDVKLTLTGSLKAGMINIPKGSKETVLDASADSRMLGTIVFDGARTPKLSGTTENDDGLLRILSASADKKMLTIDSLSAMQGAVETHNKKVVITDAVTLRSATIWPYTDSTEFMGDLVISGTGGLNTEHNANDVKRIVKIHGDFTQSKGTISGDLAGVKLHPMTTKTVMGDLMVAADASRYIGKTASGKMPSLVVHGGFHFAKKGDLDVQVEFKGEEVQEVLTGDMTVLDSVVVNNARGLLLKSHVKQQRMAKLTLRQGKIHSMPMDSMYTWTVQNVEAEQELRGRNSAQTGEKCGADNDEACKGTILRGSRQSYIGGPVARHLLQGTAGDGFKSGGYLFPVGMDHKTDQDTLSHYRPLILQLPSDLNDTTAVTVSPIMVPEGAMPAWQSLTVPTAGGSLKLDVHADLFWKVDLGAESLPTNTNIRLAAAGLRNVADASGLRIVQWDCDWEDPKLAGRVPAQADAESFAVNGYLNGVVHLTQEGIGLGSCAIFGVAANGIANPIDQADLSGGRANLQFIHNLPLTSPIDLHLGDIRIGSGMQFRSATAYRPVGAGSHELKIQAAGVPAEQAITSTLSLNPNTNTVVIAHGSLAEPKLKMLDMRMTSSVAAKAEVRLVHGSADLGAVQVQVMDPTDPMMPVSTLAGNLMLDEETRRYVALDPSVQVMRVKSTEGDVEEFYELDLYGYGGQTLVLNLSGMRNDLTILGVDRNGEIVPVQTVTGVEESAELPTEFALHGNYPNPFNPSTRIQFDLPENAQVQIQIVDMLGREVMVLPAQELEAGANRSVEMNASSLASGTYLYRLIAAGAENRHVKAGRMTLVK